jgi:RNA polymerase sigma-70 factor (ECF subfamily)
MANDTTTFHDVYSRYSADVFRFSYWLCGNADDAKDITSETFVRLWTAKAEVRVGTVKAYLFSIARNIYIRSKGREDRFSPINPEAPDAGHLPDHLTAVQSELDVTLKAMKSLPELDRTLLILLAQEELPYEEIAKITGLSVAAAKVRVFRARAKLLSLVSETQGD